MTCWTALSSFATVYRDRVGLGVSLGCSLQQILLACIAKVKTCAHSWDLVATLWNT